VSDRGCHNCNNAYRIRGPSVPMNQRQPARRLRHPLAALAAVMVCASLVFFPLSDGSVSADAAQVLVPLAVSVGIALYAGRVLWTESDCERVERIARYGWTGALVASVGVWILVLNAGGSAVMSLLLDDALTVITVSSGLGLLVGSQVMHDRSAEPADDRADEAPARERVLAETVWTAESGPTPVLTAVVTQLAELEDTDQLELDPLYEHVDPDVFELLRRQGDSQWQLRFYVDDYEVRVSGQGTVTVYDAAESTGGVDISRENGW